MYYEPADFKCKPAVGEKSDSDGEKPCDESTKDNKKFRSRSRSLVRSRLLRTKNVMFARSKQYRREVEVIILAMNIKKGKSIVSILILYGRSRSPIHSEST